jgi:hypothetical protein
VASTGREVLVITEQDRLDRSVCDLIDLTEALHDGASPQGSPARFPSV